MYGIINKSIEELVTEQFGESRWQAVKQRCNLPIDFFISTEVYDDAITYQLAGAIAAELNISVDEVLFVFGEWWILKTVTEKYSGMLQSGGDNFMQFLINLPNFHQRVMMMYPQITPPEFAISDVEEKSICIHYHSKRKGLKVFVHGLLSGLAKSYKTDAVIEWIPGQQEAETHETFKVSW